MKTSNELALFGRRLGDNAKVCLLPFCAADASPGFDALGHAHAGFSGLVFGDAWDTDWARALNVTVNVASNGWYLVGQLGSGYLVLGDVRDMIYGIGQGQWLDAGLSLAGFIPGIGDAVKTVAVVKKFATKSATAVAAAVPFIKLLPENQIAAVRKALALAPKSRLKRT